MTPTKDLLATVTPAAEPVESPTGPRPSAPKSTESGGMRADAVSLEVPVKVHGSRAVEASGDRAAHTEPFEEVTSTMIIFPQGAVLRMATPVSVGNMIVVTNQKSGQDAICRIVKVRAYAPNQSYVEAEFTHRQVGYWGVQFASDPDSAQPKASVSKLEKSVVDAPKPRSSSDTVGVSSERASISAPSKPATLETTDRKVRTPAPAASATPAADVSGGDGFPSVDEESETEAASEKSSAASSTFGSFGSSSSLGGSSLTSPASREVFARPEVASTEESSADGSKKLLLVGGLAAALVLGAGGYFFFHAHAASPAPASVSSNPVVAQNAAPAADAVSASTAAAPAANAAPAKKFVTSTANPVNNAASQAQADAARDRAAREAAPAATSEPAEPAPAHHAAEVPSLFGVLNAHPVAPHSSSVQAQAAPEMDPNAAAPSLAPAPSALPPAIVPQTNSNASKAVAVTTAPHLISSVPPEYPPLAKRMHVQGVVVIAAMIEADGSVGDAKALSGPQLLRQSALDAVRHWRYQPGRLDGHPGPVQININVDFVDK